MCIIDVSEASEVTIANYAPNGDLALSDINIIIEAEEAEVVKLEDQIYLTQLQEQVQDSMLLSVV